MSSYCTFRFAELFLTLILALDQDLNDEKVNIYDKLLDVRQQGKAKDTVIFWRILPLIIHTKHTDRRIFFLKLTCLA